MKRCSRPRRHDHWKVALSRISARAGCIARMEPRYDSVGVAAVGRQGAHADIEVTLPPPHGLTLLDIYIIHFRCATYVVAASQTRGAAAALRDWDKWLGACRPSAPWPHLCSASVETYGHLNRPIMQYLRTCSNVASARPLPVTRGLFLDSAHREPSVALVQSQGFVYRFCALLLAEASGRPVLPGADAPYLD
jgi:hypothetical protein